jgi:hypothetical protein
MGGTTISSTRDTARSGSARRSNTPLPAPPTGEPVPLQPVRSDCALSCAAIVRAEQDAQSPEFSDTRSSARSGTLPCQSGMFARRPAPQPFSWELGHSHLHRAPTVPFPAPAQPIAVSFRGVRSFGADHPDAGFTQRYFAQFPGKLEVRYRPRQIAELYEPAIGTPVSVIDRTRRVLRHGIRNRETAT